MAKKHSKQSRPKRLQENQWDPLRTPYARLSSPEWDGKAVPNRFWHDAHNHKRYFQWLAIELNIKDQEGWYKTGFILLKKHYHGRWIGNYYDSYLAALQSVFPQYHWLPWKFSTVPNGYWQKAENRIAYLKWLEKQLGYKKPEDWYQISTDTFKKHKGKGLLTQRKTFVNILVELYPDFDWLPWKFKHTEKGYWEKRTNRQKFINWLGSQLGYKKLDDWYRIRSTDVIKHGGQTAMILFGGISACNASRLVMDSFPQKSWKIWLFESVHTDWSKKQDRVDYLRWLGKQLGYTHRSDWYRLLTKDVRAHHGYSLIVSYYDYNLVNAVSELYPNRTWYPWLFSQVPNNCWDVKSNRVLYMKWLGKRLGFKTKKDWQQIQNRHFNENRGSHLISLYSHHQLLREYKPNIDWNLAAWYPWLGKNVPNGYWDEKANRILYMKWLGKQLGFKTKQDWQRLRIRHFNRHGGKYLISYYTCRQLLREFNPNIDWDKVAGHPWLTGQIPIGYWNNKENRILYMQWLGKKLGFKTKHDWQQIQNKHFCKNRGSRLIALYPHRQLLREFRPNVNWDKV